MLILSVIYGLLLTLNGNCQQNENIPDQDYSVPVAWPPGKWTPPSTDANGRSDLQFSQTDGNETAGFIRKDTRNSEVITIGRHDGYRTTFNTYENKGFYAHTGFGNTPVGSGKSQPIYHSFEGVPVSAVSANNEANSYAPKKTPISIGGRPVGLKQHDNDNANEPWMSNRHLEHQTYSEGGSVGGREVTYAPHNINSNLSTKSHKVPAGTQSIGGKPVYLTDEITHRPTSLIGGNSVYLTRIKDNPRQQVKNGTPPSYAADPSIGGHAVPLIQFNERPFSNAGISTRLTSSWPDDPEGTVEVEDTKRLSWQVSVFTKEVTPYLRICGGSLVTSTAIISAAQCFWAVSALPADRFAVGAESEDSFATSADEYSSYLQKIDVRAIKIPPRFRGQSSNNQEDIAVLLMEQPFSFHQHLGPVCVSFNPALDERQLADGSQGMVLGSSFVTKSPGLLHQRVTVISIEECLRQASEDHRRFITSDKICTDGFVIPHTSVCNQDVGSGLVFTLGPKENPAPFLRGVASGPCSASGWNAYTHIQSHRAFILQHVPDIESECQKHYQHVFQLLNDGTDGGQSAMEDSDSDEGQFVCNCYC